MFRPGTILEVMEYIDVMDDEGYYVVGKGIPDIGENLLVVSVERNLVLEIPGHTRIETVGPWIINVLYKEKIYDIGAFNSEKDIIMAYKPVWVPPDDASRKVSKQNTGSK